MIEVPDLGEPRSLINALESVVSLIEVPHAPHTHPQSCCVSVRLCYDLSEPVGGHSSPARARVRVYDGMCVMPHKEEEEETSMGGDASVHQEVFALQQQIQLYRAEHAKLQAKLAAMPDNTALRGTPHLLPPRITAHHCVSVWSLGFAFVLIPARERCVCSITSHTPVMELSCKTHAAVEHVECHRHASCYYVRTCVESTGLPTLHESAMLLAEIQGTIDDTSNRNSNGNNSTR